MFCPRLHCGLSFSQRTLFLALPLSAFLCPPLFPRIQGQMEVAEREKVRRLKAAERASLARAARFQQAEAAAAQAGGTTAAAKGGADFEASEAGLGSFRGDSHLAAGGGGGGGGGQGGGGVQEGENYADDYDFNDEDDEEGEGGSGAATSGAGAGGASSKRGAASSSLSAGERATAARRRELCRGGSVNLVGVKRGTELCTTCSKGHWTAVNNVADGVNRYWEGSSFSST